MAEWEKLREVRESVLKSLEEVRQSGDIGNSLEAKVHIRCSREWVSLLKRHEDELRFIFIVSQVTVDEAAGEDLHIHVSRTDGEKCERCWNYSLDVGKDSEYPTLCERCVPVLREM